MMTAKISGLRAGSLVCAEAFRRVGRIGNERSGLSEGQVAERGDLSPRVHGPGGRDRHRFGVGRSTKSGVGSLRWHQNFYCLLETCSLLSLHSSLVFLTKTRLSLFGTELGYVNL